MASANEWVEQPENATAPAVTSLSALKSGGAYIPPAKLRRMQEELAQNKNSDEYQRLNWENLKKHIHGRVNKVNVSNIVNVVRELLQKNVIRGMGLLASSILKAQTFSPTFSHVYAALVAIVNSKFPNIGQLILKRLVIQFKRAFRTNNKELCLTVSRFIAHLANQRVAHEILILEILVLLMDKPTDDSIEVAITLLKECGEMLNRVIPKGLHSVFERLRSILEDADTIDTRTQQMIEIVMSIRKDKFRNYPAVLEELDLIDEEDQISHIVELSLEDGSQLDPETNLNYYKYDPEFEQNEANYEEIRQKIIGDAGDSDDEADDEGQAEEVEEAPQEAPQVQKIVDMTEQDMVAFRRNVYLAIQSSLDYQEAAHKLIKFHLKPGLDNEMCHMIVDCCAQQRTYERFYGLLAERFCRLRLEFQQSFQQIARDTYNTIHRFDVKKIRIMAQLVSHLLATDAIEWAVLSEIKMNENDTSSAGRVYVKILFQELAEAMGQKELFKKLYDPTISMHFEGLLPRDHPKNTRFAINFFTLCGLGGLTIILREDYEKKMKKETNADNDSTSSSSSDSDSDSSTSSDSEDSSSSSSDSEAERKARKKKKAADKEKQQLEAPQPEIKQEVMSDGENSNRRNRSENGRHNQQNPSRVRPDSPQLVRPRQRDLSEERVLQRTEKGDRRRDKSPEERVLQRTEKGDRRRDKSPEERVPRRTERDDRRRDRSPEERVPRRTERNKDERENRKDDRPVERNNRERRREASPDRQRSRSPEKRNRRDPSNERQIEKPRDRNAERRRAQSPSEERSSRRRRSPSNERPNRNRRSPADRRNAADQRCDRPSPQRRPSRRSPSPPQRRQRSPDRNKRQEPEERRQRSPDRNKRQEPEERRQRSPDRNKRPEPEERRRPRHDSKSPEQNAAKQRRNSPSPDNKRKRETSSSDSTSSGSSSPSTLSSSDSDK